MKKIHDDTKHVLTKTFPTAVTDARKDLKSDWDKLYGEIKKLKIDEILGDRTYRVLFQQYCEKRLMSENINFLLDYSGKNNTVYNKYIKDGVREQINIDYELRVEFDTAFNGGTIRNAPWNEAVDKIKSLLNINGVGYKFADFVTDVK